MDTRTAIIQLGDSLIREKGYNAFSFSDISRHLNIKNASVHYHFPTKTDLGKAVIQQHISQLERLKDKVAHKKPLEQLEAFMSIYTLVKSENRVCIVGSLATDLLTVEPAIQQELKQLADIILHWVIGILRDGKSQGVFHFQTSERAKALMVISNMLAIVQLSRLTQEEDFHLMKAAILEELCTK